MATPPGHAITPSLSQMSRTVAEIFNRWAISARASYELVGRHPQHKTSQSDQSGFEGPYFEVPIVLALSKRSNPLFADYHRTMTPGLGHFLPMSPSWHTSWSAKLMQVN
jgi:hypothetical protein